MKNIWNRDIFATKFTFSSIIFYFHIFSYLIIYSWMNNYITIFYFTIIFICYIFFCFSILWAWAFYFQYIKYKIWYFVFFNKLNEIVNRHNDKYYIIQIVKYFLVSNFTINDFIDDLSSLRIDCSLKLIEIKSEMIKLYCV